MRKKIIAVLLTLFVLTFGYISFGKIKQYLIWMDVKIRGEQAIAGANQCSTTFGFTKSIKSSCKLVEGVCVGLGVCKELTAATCALTDTITCTGQTAGGTVLTGFDVGILDTAISMAQYKSGDPMFGCGVMATQISTFADPGGVYQLGKGYQSNDSKFVWTQRIENVANYIIAGFKNK